VKRVLFIPYNCVPFHGKTLEEKPLGGTETGVINLAKSLNLLGIEVLVASDYQNPPPTEPLYIPTKSLHLAGSFDAIIGIRDWRSLLVDIPTKNKFLLTGDAFDQPSTIGIGDKRIISIIDKILFVSDWQQQTICKESGFPIEKTAVIRNGVDLSRFENSKRYKKIPARLIYSSTPYRGLKLLLEIFPKIKEKIPHASLVICSGYDVYGGAKSTPKEALLEFEHLKDQFLRMDDIIFRGNLKQSELAEEFLKAEVLTYPNIFPETSCITAMEAIAASTVTISSNIGALNETVKDCGILLNESINTENYKEKFIEKTIELLENQEKLKALKNNCEREKNNISWELVAKKVINLI
jgi:glycosyltransferase involved in cell wall biosynthesis